MKMYRRRINMQRPASRTGSVPRDPAPATAFESVPAPGAGWVPLWSRSAERGAGRGRQTPRAQTDTQRAAKTHKSKRERRRQAPETQSRAGWVRDRQPARLELASTLAAAQARPSARVWRVRLGDGRPSWAPASARPAPCDGAPRVALQGFPAPVAPCTVTGLWTLEPRVHVNSSCRVPSPTGRVPLRPPRTRPASCPAWRPGAVRVACAHTACQAVLPASTACVRRHLLPQAPPSARPARPPLALLQPRAPPGAGLQRRGPDSLLPPAPRWRRPRLPAAGLAI